MAVNDRTPTELVAPTALSATATAVYTNPGASYRTEATMLSLANTGSTLRTITLYKNGTATTNIWLCGIEVPAGKSVEIPCAKVFTGTQILAVKQDTGTDINITMDGVVEQIA